MPDLIKLVNGFSSIKPFKQGRSAKSVWLLGGVTNFNLVKFINNANNPLKGIVADSLTKPMLFDKFHRGLYKQVKTK